MYIKIYEKFSDSNTPFPRTLLPILISWQQQYPGVTGERISAVAFPRKLSTRENQNRISELRGKPLCIMQRMEKTRGQKEKRERIADTPFIAIGSERLFYSSYTSAAQSRQTRIRHKHRHSYRHPSLFPLWRLCLQGRTAFSSLADMIHISFFP